jgi:hypothetical protein
VAYVVLAVMLIVTLVLGGTGLWIAGSVRRRKLELARRARPYEVHRARWEKTGDTAELDAMIREIGKGDR